MRSRSRLIIRGLKPEDFKCDLPEEEEETLCSDCGVVMKLPAQIIGGRCYCKECAPWYRKQAANDARLIEQDLLRGYGIGTAAQEIAAIGFESDLLSSLGKHPRIRSTEELENELDFGERDYWD